MSKERIRSAPLRYHVSAGTYGRVARRSERRGSWYGLARVPGARENFGYYFAEAGVLYEFRANHTRLSQASSSF